MKLFQMLYFFFSLYDNDFSFFSKLLDPQARKFSVFFYSSHPLRLRLALLRHPIATALPLLSHSISCATFLRSFFGL